MNRSYKKNNLNNIIKLKLTEYFELVKFEHTIFAMPFALAGMLLAKPQEFPSVNIFIWVILAIIGGRTAAMSLNRLIDADIDKLNPRTSNRAIPSGKIKKISALILSILSFGLMIFATWHLPLICRQLLPVAIFILILYSYTKRFTNLSHLVLGSALGAAASGGWMAVSGSISIPVILWGMAVSLWVAGFDIIYAIQDFEFDRKNKLFSIPAWLGIKNSLLVSKFFHFLTIIMLIVLGSIYQVGMFYWIGILFAGFLLAYEHSLIKEQDLSKINAAFFNVNGFLSIGLFLFILADKIW